MKTLKTKELNSILSNEGSFLSEIAPISVSNYSVFHFSIEETVEELRDRIKNPACDEFGEKAWEVRDYDGRYYFSDDFSNCRARAYLDDSPQGRLIIISAMSCFKYEVTNLPQGGAEVFFDGPLNALLRQNLLPKMTYISHTLEAKYDDMEDFLSIEEYCFLRKEKAEGKANDQDVYGFWVNKNFYNEIPCLPVWVDMDEEEEESEDEEEEVEFEEEIGRMVYEKRADRGTFEDICYRSLEKLECIA